MSYDVHLLDFNRHDARQTAHDNQQLLNDVTDTINPVCDLLTEARDYLASDNSAEGRRIAQEIEKILPSILSICDRV
jgi:hypothetical protein